ncbi:PRC-barrel domain-containing protein [Siccirubricoccus sp. G192]|uniref:PRC-barrel domain-containing protein n=1 Tax=Siccirubricoccus sp. G192 TaxID=2849651 RepID=UPI001C2C7C5D|nr:PRC-barrel domain-containing protein [Siccirubricoccus sp. G192]MBV1797783.1 PRC-barrel domain-containing protein [Siccirubricoccus sp. G192]
MERRSLAALLLGATAAFSLGDARAQGTPGSPAAGSATGLAAGQIRAKDLIDRDLYSSDGTEIGEIEDLVIEPASGRVVSVVVEVESRLGFTEKYVTVPLQRLHLGEGRRVAADMTREQFRTAPGIRYRD